MIQPILFKYNVLCVIIFLYYSVDQNNKKIFRRILMEIILNFIGKYFFDSLIVLGFGIVSKVALTYVSNARWESIKEIVLTSMLWAEETFDLGHGQEKWTKAWQKIIVLLQKKGIKLKEKEISFVTDMMKSNVPIINSITYSTVPEALREMRDIPGRSPEIKKLLESLRKKRTKPLK